MTGDRVGSEGCPPDPDHTPGEALAAALIWTTLVVVLILILITAY